MAEDGRARRLWVGAIAVATIFVVAGGLKLLAADRTVPWFQDMGFPAWFNYAVGAFEVVFGLLILWPRAAFYAACALVGEMMLAFITTAANGRWGFMLLSVVVALLVGWVGWGRHPPWLRERL